MAVTYFKRYRMELRLDRMNSPPAEIRQTSAGLHLVPWSPRLLNQHAEVKWKSFRNEIDSHVFPCLGELDGCKQLMREISGRKNFVPQATWLACLDTSDLMGNEPMVGSPRRTLGLFSDGELSRRHPPGVSTTSFGATGSALVCGTVQGLLSSRREGAIQNLGVHPECRDLGVGSALLWHALEGFRQVGCRYANLEVTVQNTSAIRLYERFGFRRVETLFKIADVQYA